ncbi:glycosyltransferase [Clostridium algidicarnis]|uniref:Glycosyltransferase involved in cell wall biosynthesis n=1 Tax=Clostridium algidicarnis DSM 15099 TaxID=1121295 RepID=A0A2S6FW26_9CLOT|nr:glycosyltransferase [Clostridium algidicarnis]PPK46398.1 glycosyltransferase involved in cell wall biosynthesis [Clostridium algidicarnis DSM 15099]
MEKLKVMHVVTTDKLSGAEKVVLDIESNLDKERFLPFALCKGGDLKDLYENAGIKTYVADLSSLNPREIKKLKAYLKESSIDILHAHDVKASIAARIASKGLNIPVISHMHSSYPWLEGMSPLKYIDAFYRGSYKLSIACSDMVKEHYLKYNKKISKDKIKVLNNSFNFNELKGKSIIPKEEMRHKLNIKNDTYVFGFLGRLLDIKGVDLLINSFNEISKKIPESMLVIVGDGSERERLEAMVKDYGLEKKVLFEGYQKDVYSYLNMFDTFILPSKLEGLPMAVLEAMAMKIPVISTPVAGVKNLIKDNYNGIILKTRDEKSLYEAMTKMYYLKDERNIMVENAYKYLFENYNIDIYMNNLQNIYKNIV